MIESTTDRVTKFIEERNKAAASKPNPLKQSSNVDLHKLGGITVAPSSPQQVPEKTK